jgi:hypothetical protein
MRFATLLAILLVVPAGAAFGGMHRVREDSVSVTTKDRHCPKNCTGWAGKQPTLKLVLKMSKEDANRGYYYRDPNALCEGSACGWKDLGRPRTSDNGTTVTVAYRTWSRPVDIVLAAEVWVNDDTNSWPAPDAQSATGIRPNAKAQASEGAVAGEEKKQTTTRKKCGPGTYDPERECCCCPNLDQDPGHCVVKSNGWNQSCIVVCE